jgi:hypothetical protein
VKPLNAGLSVVENAPSCPKCESLDVWEVSVEKWYHTKFGWSSLVICWRCNWRGWPHDLARLKNRSATAPTADARSARGEA